MYFKKFIYFFATFNFAYFLGNFTNFYLRSILEIKNSDIFIIIYIQGIYKLEEI